MKCMARSSLYLVNIIHKLGQTETKLTPLNEPKL